ncbi:methionine ABC transporter ATP-binding protein MetN [Aeromonas simiae]|uniref:methionine ABC transporter ATP-binding protein MetN n=1 Tax=Aeromonas simiae TaxID=218936 RepID=UPI0005AA4D65|nr:methionine ABC transporter ATP-binding protein MetN [Aeromonas simiae]MDO2948117.1 methionine ABC transporter ATP-binding protein MetN [Aeromonas simiae]MDO2952857.1 methionine ABC transporter ATP-binding protein MetN [Aeromonas simiae]MDO2955464.1 methionine ABC transporter ATP-binding protein MetN [Aeromonas simiae]
MIQLKGLSKVYGDGSDAVYALREVSLDVPQGKIVGVIGASGAGKSTLIRCVNLLERPTTGQVIVDSQDLTALSDNELTQARRQIGMIFQHFNLLSSRTVAGNVALPLELAGWDKARIGARVKELLSLVGLEQRAHAYPAELSGGQKQRVAIARALAPSPKVLLCDEATSALDPQTTHSILALLKEINAKLGLTILLITHEMDVVKRICDEVAIISDGRLIEHGEVAWFFSHAKTELARDFIRSTIHLPVPDEYQARLSPTRVAQSNPLVKLGFTGNTVDSPLISEVSRRFNIDISILSADIEYAGGVKFGFLLAELFGSPEQCDAAQAFFIEHHIQLEVLGYVRSND